MPTKISVATVVAAIWIAGATITPLANAAPTDDACSVLTPAQVSATVNVPVGAGTYVMPTVKKTCTWTATGSAAVGVKFVTVLLQSLDAYQGGKAMGQMKNVTVTRASGVGDEAYYLAVGVNVGLIVKRGSTAFKVAVYGGIPLEKKEALEKALALLVVPKL
jgi:hypothetical protein